MIEIPAYNPKEIAWNGVRFRVPSGWEISRMGHRYLQLEDDDGPVFELKWQSVKGRFSHDDHLKKIGAGHWRRKGIEVEAGEPPDHWRDALGRYSARAFRWQGARLGGEGAVLYCAVCRTALLVQFLRDDIVADKALCSGILASLRDHSSSGGEGRVRWAVYDLRAEVPVAFTLKDYRFHAGEFTLTFDGPGHALLSLHRWGPASMVLARQTLDQFVGSRFTWIDHRLAVEMIKEDGFIHVEGVRSRLGWVLWLRRMARKPAFHWLHAWRDEARNRILAVDARGSHPLPHQTLEEVSDGYVVV